MRPRARRKPRPWGCRASRRSRVRCADPVERAGPPGQHPGEGSGDALPQPAPDGLVLPRAVEPVEHAGPGILHPIEHALDPVGEPVENPRERRVDPVDRRVPRIADPREDVVDRDAPLAHQLEELLAGPIHRGRHFVPIDPERDESEDQRQQRVRGSRAGDGFQPSGEQAHRLGSPGQQRREPAEEERGELEADGGTDQRRAEREHGGEKILRTVAEPVVELERPVSDLQQPLRHGFQPLAQVFDDEARAADRASPLVFERLGDRLDRLVEIAVRLGHPVDDPGVLEGRGAGQREHAQDRLRVLEHLGERVAVPVEGRRQRPETLQQPLLADRLAHVVDAEADLLERLLAHLGRLDQLGEDPAQRGRRPLRRDALARHRRHRARDLAELDADGLREREHRRERPGEGAGLEFAFADRCGELVGGALRVDAAVAVDAERRGEQIRDDFGVAEPGLGRLRREGQDVERRGALEAGAGDEEQRLGELDRRLAGGLADLLDIVLPRRELLAADADQALDLGELGLVAGEAADREAGAGGQRRARDPGAAGHRVELALDLVDPPLEPVQPSGVRLEVEDGDESVEDRRHRPALRPLWSRASWSARRSLSYRTARISFRSQTPARSIAGSPSAPRRFRSL